MTRYQRTLGSHTVRLGQDELIYLLFQNGGQLQSPQKMGLTNPAAVLGAAADPGTISDIHHLTPCHSFEIFLTLGQHFGYSRLPA